jgi:hypothetical protein
MTNIRFRSRLLGLAAGSLTVLTAVGAAKAQDCAHLAGAIATSGSSFQVIVATTLAKADWTRSGRYAYAASGTGTIPPNTNPLGIATSINFVFSDRGFNPGKTDTYLLNLSLGHDPVGSLTGFGSTMNLALECAGDVIVASLISPEQSQAWVISFHAIQ